MPPCSASSSGWRATWTSGAILAVSWSSVARGPSSVVELGGEPIPFVADLAQPGGDLALRPIGVADKVEEAVFLLFEVGQLLSDPPLNLDIDRV